MWKYVPQHCPTWGRSNFFLTTSPLYFWALLPTLNMGVHTWYRTAVISKHFHTAMYSIVKFDLYPNFRPTFDILYKFFLSDFLPPSPTFGSRFPPPTPTFGSQFSPPAPTFGSRFSPPASTFGSQFSPHALTPSQVPVVLLVKVQNTLVGFEPTQSKKLIFQTSALDHSPMQPYTVNNKLDLYFV